MKLTYNIPENKSDITVSQFIALNRLYKNAEENETEVNEKELVSICIDIPYHLIDKLPFDEYNLALESIAKTLSIESTFYQRFEYRGREFGFIPDLENITAGEFAALDMFFKDSDKHALDILNVLYRPVKEEKTYSNWWSKEEVKKYVIEPYDNEVDINYFKDVPYEIYEGSMIFFYNLGKDLLVATQKYMSQEEAKMTEAERLEKSGDGIKHLILTLNQQISTLMTFTKNLQVKYYLD